MKNNQKILKFFIHEFFFVKIDFLERLTSSFSILRVFGFSEMLLIFETFLWCCFLFCFLFCFVWMCSTIILCQAWPSGSLLHIKRVIFSLGVQPIFPVVSSTTKQSNAMPFFWTHLKISQNLFFKSEKESIREKVFVGVFCFLLLFG
jgi:hypothetical protein